jgi:hypothetical protein
MLYTYCLRFDNGAAPNPYWGTCTLVICKPKIRQVARPGDWIAGFGSANSPVGDISGKLVYAMKVSRVMPMPDYDAFCRLELPDKITNSASDEFPRRLGDCIYDFSTARPRIRPSVHGEDQRERDLSGMNALLSDHFYYFGDKPIDLPERLAPIIHRGQGHKSQRNAPYERAFGSWIDSLEIAPNRLYGNPQGRPPMIYDGGEVAACDPPSRSAVAATGRTAVTTSVPTRRRRQASC